MNVIGLAEGRWQNAIDFFRRVDRLFGWERGKTKEPILSSFFFRQGFHNPAQEFYRMLIIFSKMIRNARESCVDVCAAEFLCSDIFPRRGFDERRSAQEDRACAFDDDGFI